MLSERQTEILIKHSKTAGNGGRNSIAYDFRNVHINPCHEDFYIETKDIIIPSNPHAFSALPDRHGAKIRIARLPPYLSRNR